MSHSLSNCYFDLNLSLALLIPQAKGVPEVENSRRVPLKIKPTERRYVRVHPALDHPADDRNHVRSPARLRTGARTLLYSKEEKQQCDAMIGNRVGSWLATPT